MSNETIIALLMHAPVVIFSLTIHEFAHAFAAYKMGDPTAARMGRLTLNPLAHLDPIGTICLFFAPIGWAKPVPIIDINFDDRRKGVILSTAAGPASNLCLALLCALLMRALAAANVTPLSSGNSGPGQMMAGQVEFTPALLAYFILGKAMLLNIGLAMFNLIPLHPLDGSHIMRENLSGQALEWFNNFSRHAPMILMALILVPSLLHLNIDPIGAVIRPPFTAIMKVFAGKTVLEHVGMAMAMMSPYSLYRF